MRTARWAGLLLGASMTAASCAGSPPAMPEGAVPILFVHGYGTSSAVFDTMINHLEERGYPASYLKAVDLVPADGDNVVAAGAEIAPAVEELVAAAGGGPGMKIDLVAHSMGALSSRWYATKIQPDRVRTLLTIGGANHGTDALCGYPTPGGFDLCPAFATDPAHTAQVGLNGTAGTPVDETPYGGAADAPGAPSAPPDGARRIRYVAVTVPADQWIRPGPSSSLAGADFIASLPDDVDVVQTAPGNLVFDEPTDHDAILNNDRFLELLDTILPGGGTT